MPGPPALGEAACVTSSSLDPVTEGSREQLRALALPEGSMGPKAEPAARFVAARAGTVVTSGR